jgi:phosphoglycolate phosphatase-like HAD superfamily hydrolase
MFTYAFDFDGVLCDSANETAHSGWKACQIKWPDLFNSKIEKKYVVGFSAVRPVLKTGYEAMILIYLLKTGNSVEQILANYDNLKKEFYKSTGATVDGLKDVFGNVRDRWIKDDFDGWLEVNTFYPGVIEAIKKCNHPLYIVTTKQKRFAVALCKYAGLDLPEENIFGLESGEKSISLQKIHESYPDNPILFIEDRLINLLETDVNNAQLFKFYADWGYGTQDDYKKAKDNPDLKIISLEIFSNFIKNPAEFVGND